MKVVIGIQARSTSTRFPGKVFEKIDNKSMLDHVIDNCRSSARYIMSNSYKTKIDVDVVLLIPEGDKILKTHGSKIQIIEGPESDVLTRYVGILSAFEPDFIVRITSDCPMIKKTLISKVINAGVYDSNDYLSNVDQEIRTAVDGWDVEIMSSKMLRWLDSNAKKPYDREHVTTLARSAKPSWARVGHIVHDIDLSKLKLSVDTKEDLEKVKEQYFAVKRAVEIAESRGEKVYRF